MTELPTSEAADRLATDDGQMDLTPAFVANHVIGEDFIRVRVGFSSIALQSGVWLSPNGYVELNGIRMRPDVAPRSFEHVARIPLGDATLHVQLARSDEKRVAFDIAMPMFKVESFPNHFRNPERLTIRMTKPYVQAPASVVDDAYSLEIMTGAVCRFHQVKGPTGEHPELTLEPILKNNPQPKGYFGANLFRLQRTPLNRITTMFQTGWFATTVTERFSIEVLG